MLNASLPFDRRLYRQDITGSIAHAKMLARQSIISEADGEAIVKGLQSILADIEAGTLVMEGAEDIHSFVEQELTNRIGDAGKRLHTARSRNDQVALDMRMYVKEEITKIHALLLDLIKVLCAKAREHLTTVMPGLHASAAGTAGHAGTCVYGVWQHAAQRLCASEQHF